MRIFLCVSSVELFELPHVHIRSSPLDQVDEVQTRSDEPLHKGGNRTAAVLEGPPYIRVVILPWDFIFVKQNIILNNKFYDLFKNRSCIYKIAL
jgi:hypothetical protein